MLCKFNKFGHCKFSEKCKYLHVEAFCENKSCDIFSCDKQHPVTCKYFSFFGKCKFSPCSYSHAKPFEIERMEKLEKTIKMNEKEIKELHSKVDVQKEKILELEKCLVKQGESDFNNEVLTQRFIKLESGLSQMKLDVSESLEILVLT